MKKTIAILFVISILIWVFFDCIYIYNLFGLDHVGKIYKGEFISTGYVLCVCDDLPFLLISTLCAYQFLKEITAMKYVCSLCMDIIVTAAIFSATTNPDMENWSRVKFIAVAFGLFFLKIILHNVSPAFRKLKIF